MNLLSDLVLADDPIRLLVYVVVIVALVVLLLLLIRKVG